MARNSITIEELTQKRTPSGLLNWVIQKIDQVEVTDEGVKVIRFGKGLAKQLMEEVYPLALFARRKYGNERSILVEPVIGPQNYDAIIHDLRDKPTSQSYIETTQSHEGENDHLKRLVLQEQGFVFPQGTVTKVGTKRRGMRVSITPEWVEVGETAEQELRRICDAAEKKSAKDYLPNTSLLIVFKDDPSFRKVVNDARLDTVVKQRVLSLDLRFSTLYLVGWRETFREYHLRG